MTRTDDAILRAFRAPPRRSAPRAALQGQAGTSTGLNIEPGSDDDGWIVPDPARLSDGTLVQLYKDGEALHAAYDAIQAARRRICLEVYIFASDATGWAFADLLARKAREGVHVYVLYDSFGSARSDRKMLSRMWHAGVRLQAFHPIRPWDCHHSWRPFNRDHRKLLVIDDDIAGLGGINIGAEYAGSWIVPGSIAECDCWRDNAVSIRGPGARVFNRAFARSWNYAMSGGPISRAQFTHGLEDESDLGVLASVPSVRGPLRPEIHKLLGGARESIQLTMAYFAPDDDLIDALCRAARRGVRVQLMLPAKCDVHLLVIAARSFYEKLLTAGVEIHERQAAVLHSKTVVVDGRVSVVGSTNLDYRSIEYNCEISVIIRNREFGRQMNDLFANDMLYAEKIELSEWRKRPYYDRIIQWMVSRARYLL